MEYVGARLLRVRRQPKPLRQGVNLGDCHGDFCWWIGRPQLAPLSVMNAYLPRGSVGLEALGPWGPVLGPRQSLLFVGFFMPFTFVSNVTRWRLQKARLKMNENPTAANRAT